jgi:hypothetical protein
MLFEIYQKDGCGGFERDTPWVVLAKTEKEAIQMILKELNEPGLQADNFYCLSKHKNMILVDD